MTTRKLILKRSGATFSIVPGSDLGAFASENMAEDVSEILRQIEDSQTPDVIVDFEGREYFGSAMLEALLRIWHAVRDRSGRMVLCRVSKVGSDLLKVAHFEKIWPIFETREEAEKELRQSES